ILPLLLIFLSFLATEREITEKLASKYNAQTEVIAWDNTRVDLLNDEYAIEVDWAYKWAEAVGQATYYGIVHNRKPGIILLRRKGENVDRYVYRCQVCCAKYGIPVWVEEVE